MLKTHNNYEKEKTKRNWKIKEELTAHERYMRDSLRESRLTNYLLGIAVLLLTGIFFRLVFG